MFILLGPIQHWFYLIIKGEMTVKRVGFGLFFVACLVVAVACGPEKDPLQVLPKEDMVRVLTEIYLAEEKVQRLGLRTDSSAKLFARVTKKIEERTGIPDSIFQNSLRYYMERPRELQDIYTILVDSLSLMEQRSSIGTEAQ
jgi:hypothetical protein